MVNEKTLRRVHKFSVHRDHSWPFGTVIIETNGIEGFVISPGEPVEVVEPVEVLLVNNCAFAFG
jgi:hypothetical protein